MASSQPFQIPAGVHLIPVLEAEHGLEGLVSLQAGGNLVPIDRVANPRVLEFVIRGCALRFAHNGAKNKSQEIDLDGLHSFSGGYALCIDGEVQIEPRCCGDLSDIDDWRMAAGHRGAETIGIWIGHPMIQVRFDGENLVFTEAETSGELNCVVSPDALSEAVDRASGELMSFRNELISMLEALVPKGHVQEIARRLICV